MLSLFFLQVAVAVVVVVVVEVVVVVVAAAAAKRHYVYGNRQGNQSRAAATYTLAGPRPRCGKEILQQYPLPLVGRNSNRTGTVAWSHVIRAFRDHELLRGMHDETVLGD